VLFRSEIAFNTADVDDGLEAGLLTIDQILAGAPLFANFHRQLDAAHPQARAQLKFNESLKRVLDYFATDLIETTRANIAASHANSVEDIRHSPKRLASFSPDAMSSIREQKSFLKQNLYDHPSVAEDRDRGVAALAALFRHYMSHPESLPQFYFEEATHSPGDLPRARIVTDYIAGMTDQFLLRTHNDLLV
jgi:dGTPase